MERKICWQISWLSEADSVSFDTHRDKQASADIQADAEIGIGGALADEFINPNPVPDDARQAEALQGLDPIIQEQLARHAPRDPATAR